MRNITTLTTQELKEVNNVTTAKNKRGYDFIELKKIYASQPKQTRLDKRDYLRWEVIGKDDESYRFNTSTTLTDNLDKALDKGKLPFTQLELVTGTYTSQKNGKIEYRYYEVTLPDLFKEKFEKKVLKSFEETSNDDDQVIVWD